MTPIHTAILAGLLAAASYICGLLVGRYNSQRQLRTEHLRGYTEGYRKGLDAPFANQFSRQFANDIKPIKPKAPHQ